MAEGELDRCIFFGDALYRFSSISRPWVCFVGAVRGPHVVDLLERPAISTNRRWEILDIYSTTIQRDYVNIVYTYNI